MSRPSAATLVALLGVPAWLGTTSSPVGPGAWAGPKDAPALQEVREIDLTAIYSSSAQKKLERVERHLPENSPELKALAEMNEALRDARTPPLLAVVRGENVKEAVLASARFVKSKPRPARPLGPDDKSTSKKVWLFVHLSHTGSTPPQWLIYPPTVFAHQARFTYTSFEGWFSDWPRESTTDDHAYFYWVPLGTFETPNEVEAELVEFSKTVKSSFPPRAKKK